MKAKVAAAFWPEKAASTMASLEMKPAVPTIVSGIPTPVIDSVPMTMVQ